ncbi:MAG: hypothetical protein DRJ01_05965 [Bacteroidetes bacterium]|nr:MAG: hypothetical protein DRJ01_05965 [Bacteroidota bacterium]
MGIVNLNDEKNFAAIKRIVRNNLSLSDKSVVRFNKIIDSGINSTDEINEFFKGCPDGRRRFKVAETDYKELDIGWEKFKKVFYFVRRDLNITYENFKDNQVEYKKNKFKLVKAITDWFLNAGSYVLIRQGQLIDDYRDTLEDWTALTGNFLVDTSNNLRNDLIKKKEAVIKTQEIIKYYMDQIGASKIAKSSNGLELVITRNFADWFMCSTAETWSSCLNFESEYPYWAGIPGLIVDPNRVLAYITDGQRKTAYGVEVDRFISRTWIVQDREDVFHHLRWYPSKMFKNKILRRYSKLNVPELREHDWISKLPLDLLFHKEEIGSCFIFMDMSCWLVDDEGKVFIVGFDEGGFTFIEEGTYPAIIEDEDHFQYCDGLQYLIDNKEEIIYAKNRSIQCNECGVRLSEEEVFTIGFNDYCEDCYNNA